MRAMQVAIGEDPSLTFANSAPDPRQGVWQHQDALRLVQRAWRQGHYGLAAVIAVAWDTMLSPIDVRQLTAGQRVRDDQGALFFVDRAKTGRAAAGTLSRWSSAILDAYLGKISVVPVGDAPLFRNRSGAPYSKDTLGDDFRAVGLWCSERMTIASLPTYVGQALSRQRWAGPRSRSWPRKWPTLSRPRPGCRTCTIQLT